MKPPSYRAGLSLLEVMLGVIVLSVLAVAVMSYARQPGERAKRQACDLRIQQLQVLVQQYQKDYGRYPNRSMSQLSGDRYLGETLPRCPLDGSRYLLDRSTGTIVPHGH